MFNIQAWIDRLGWGKVSKISLDTPAEAVLDPSEKESPYKREADSLLGFHVEEAVSDPIKKRRLMLLYHETASGLYMACIHPENVYNYDRLCAVSVSWYFSNAGPPDAFVTRLSERVRNSPKLHPKVLHDVAVISDTLAYLQSLES